MRIISIVIISFTFGLTACGGGDQADTPDPIVTAPEPTPIPQEANATDIQLQSILASENVLPIQVDALNLPSIEQVLPQLGKQLFFTKNLGGEQTSACVSCHHPTLGGGDALSLSVGVGAVNQFDIDAPDLLGHGRFNSLDNQNLPSVPRNSPTIFNLGLNTNALFWDGRVERLQNGSIATPESTANGVGFRVADSSLPVDATLAAAQAKFPVTSREEMRGVFLPSSDNASMRQSLSERFDNSANAFINEWPQAFELAYGDTEINFNRIAQAIGEYERSMVFVESPWQAYLNGDNSALSEDQKQGALAFFTPRQQGGSGCSACHNGPTLSDNQYHLVAFPQIGVGKGDISGNTNSADFGREQVSDEAADRYHFKTPSLLNIAVTAPYGHAGAFNTLREVVAHYNNPTGSINTLFNAQNGQAFRGQMAPICDLPQYADIIQKNILNCTDAFPDAYANSIAVAQHLQQSQNGTVAATSPLIPAQINQQQVLQIVAFLQALTDPCVTDSNCLSPWKLDSNDAASFPDDMLLLAVDENDIEQ